MGHFEILNMDQLEALPKFPWDQFYHMPEVALHGAHGAVAQSVATGGELEGVAPTYVPHIPNTVTLQEVWR